MTEKYVWSDIKKQVREWAKACIRCQKCKVSRPTKSKLGEFEQPDERFSVVHIHWCAKIKDEVEKLAYKLNEEAERTERPIRRLSKVMYGSTCADMQVDVIGECLSSIKYFVGVR
ncbi:uncharacterized protein TNCV_1564951 [Trichonephila clavipes]|nr:uncharacterized protein TNCV_1564951 [Trichonephila clavipes]